MRVRLKLIPIALLLCLLTTAAIAQPTTNPAPLVPPDLDQRISTALAYLATQQKPDGSFDDGNPAIASPTTSLALLAYLSAGHMPDEGKHGLVVRGAMDYLVKQAAPDDGLFSKPQSRATDLALATLALAESSGAESDPRQRRQARAALDKGVAAIAGRQTTQPSDPAYRGGWADAPDVKDPDATPTSLCVLALVAAKNAGADIPRETVPRAGEFLLACYRADQLAFAPRPGANASPIATASALLALRPLGQSTRPEFLAGIDYLQLNWARLDPGTQHLPLYILAHAAYRSRELWPRGSNALYPLLLARQLPDGSFRPAPREPGRMLDRNRAQSAYATSLAVLTLSLNNRLLPIQQR